MAMARAGWPTPATLVLLTAWVLLAGCETAYYGAMEQVGYHKRDILVNRVEAAMESQEDAKQEFENALEQFSSVVSVPVSELRRTYDGLNAAFEDAEAEAEEVRERIDAVESVSDALFDEWRDEIELIGDRQLKAASSRQLEESQARYEELMRAMRSAEARMEPVLGTFRDYVLYLKHNLNAQAIASLEGELAGIESDVARLIREMEASIREARTFIQAME
jgi:DNA repair exonuclease SbcCD ATPase subunit